MLADAILRQNLTVRATEKLLASHASRTGLPRPASGDSATGGVPALAPALLHVQNRLQQRLATHVVLHHAEKRGRIEIEYYGTDDLQRILQLFGISEE